MDFSLLFVLPDRKNKNILTVQIGDRYNLPTYDKPVGVNAGFDESQLYNDFFRDFTGISVFRRYIFNTDNYVVFVFEQTDEMNNVPNNECQWILYSDFLDGQQNGEIKNIVSSVSRYYNKSVNMPWINGFSAYFAWLREVCSAKNICINGPITQVKNAYVSTVFCIPTNDGKLYMKIPGKVYISELTFTNELRKLKITDLPVWVDYNSDMNVFLMKDMCGTNLSPQSDIETLKKVVLRLARMQKNSIQYLPLDFEHNDYRLGTILNNLNDFPQQAFEILLETRYKITYDEKEKLERNLRFAVKLLESIMNLPIPDTIQHGDLNLGNIRIVGEKVIF